MRIAGLVLLFLCAAQLVAEEEEPWSRLLFAQELDIDVEFRTGRVVDGPWVNSIGAFTTYRHVVVPSGSSSFGFGPRASFEQWFGIEPAPRRYLFGVEFDVGADSTFGGSYWNWPAKPGALQTSRRWKFPLARHRVISMRLAVGAEYSRTDAFGEHTSGRNDPAPQDGLRTYAKANAGFFFVSVEPGVATTLNLGEADPDVEAWIHIAVGRPYSPFSGHVGYRYHNSGRFTVHFFSMGFQAAF